MKYMKMLKGSSYTTNLTYQYLDAYGVNYFGFYDLSKKSNKIVDSDYVGSHERKMLSFNGINKQKYKNNELGNSPKSQQTSSQGT